MNKGRVRRKGVFWTPVRSSEAEAETVRGCGEKPDYGDSAGHIKDFGFYPRMLESCGSV